MMRKLALFPFLLLALAGCGGNGPTKAESAELHAAAEAQPKLETTRERTLQVEQRHREEQQEAQEKREEKQREDQERQERAAQEAIHREHSYPSDVRDRFVKECEASSGHEDATCRCAIQRIEAKVPYKRFQENEAEVREGKPISFIYGFEIGYCATSSAISG